MGADESDDRLEAGSSSQISGEALWVSGLTSSCQQQLVIEVFGSPWIPGRNNLLPRTGIL